MYDNHTRRVPNNALVLFMPAAFAAPFICASESGWDLLAQMLIHAGLGAAAGFCILLSAAVASKNGNGIGGGDIKLGAVLGFIYGTTGIIVILMTASALAAAAGIYQKKKSGGQILRLPFVPYMAVGVLIVTITLFI